jgi:DNA-binding MarR family transcriptional regulator
VEPSVTENCKSESRDLLCLIPDVAGLLRTRYDRWAREHGFTYAQCITLSRLRRRPGALQSELAKQYDMAPVTVGRLIKKLELRGLIEHRSDVNDRRIRRVYLLPASESVLTLIDSHALEHSAFVTDGIDLDEVQTVMRAIIHIKGNLASRDRIPAGRKGTRHDR